MKGFNVLNKKIIFLVLGSLMGSTVLLTGCVGETNNLGANKVITTASNGEKINDLQTAKTVSVNVSNRDFIRSIDCAPYEQEEGNSVEMVCANSQFNADGSNPQVVLGRFDSSVSYYDGRRWEQLHDDSWHRFVPCNSNSMPQMSTQFSMNRRPQIVVGLETGAVEYYTGHGWKELHDTGWNNRVTQMVVKFADNGNPQVVVGLSNGAVEYYNGNGWEELHGNSWAKGVVNDAVTQISAQFNINGRPQVVIGLKAEGVHYYNGNSWEQLHNYGWQSEVLQLLASSNVNGRPQIVVGLGNGAVEYYNGSGWEEFHNNGWKSGAVQMSAQFNGNDKPSVVVGLDNSAVEYYNGNGWEELHDNGWSWGWKEGITKQMATQFGANGKPQIMMGLRNDSIEYYNGNGWEELYIPTDFRQSEAFSRMSVQFNVNGRPQLVDASLHGGESFKKGQIIYYNGNNWTYLNDNPTPPSPSPSPTPAPSPDVPNQEIAHDTTLESGQSLIIGEPKDLYKKLLMQSDGDLVSYSCLKTHCFALGATHTGNHPGAKARWQNDGNLVIYDAHNQAFWSLDTLGKSYDSSYKLIYQDNGNLVIYTKDHKSVVWSLF